MEQFLSLVDKLGFPAACLVFVIIGLWIIVKWTGKNVILPITKSHIELIGKAKQTNVTNAETLVKMAQASEVTCQSIVRIADQHEEGLKLTREIHQHLVTRTGIQIRAENEAIRAENKVVQAENDHIRSENEK